MMKNKKQSITALCLILVFFAAVLPDTSLAFNDGPPDKSSPRPHKSTGIGPIGFIESLAQVRINGRIASGREMIWNGDLLSVAPDGIVRVNVDFVGQLVLSHGTVARFSAIHESSVDGGSQAVLVVSLIEGNISAKIEERAVAYVETGDSILTAFGGSFRIRMRDGESLIDSVSGAVNIQRYERFLTTTVLRLDQARLQKDKRQNMKAKVKKKEARTRRVAYNTYSIIGQDQEFGPEEPAAGREVEFKVDPPSLGEFIPSTRITLANGETEPVTFIPKEWGSGTIIARIKHDPNTEKVDEIPLVITVLRPQISPGLKTILILGGIAGTALLMRWKYGGDDRDERGPLRDDGSPVVMPRR